LLTSSSAQLLSTGPALAATLQVCFSELPLYYRDAGDLPEAPILTKHSLRWRRLLAATAKSGLGIEFDEKRWRNIL